MQEAGEDTQVLGPPAQGTEERERDLASIALAFLYAAGGTLGLASLLPAHAPEVEAVAVAVVASSAYPIAALVIALRPLSWPLLHAGIALGVVLITFAIEFSGQVGGAYSFYYLWAVLFAAYFFSRRAAATHLLFVAAAYAGVIVLTGATTEWGLGWMLTIGSLTVASVLVRALKERVDRLVERLSHAADTDVLTGLLNRRGFNRCLREELLRSTRSDQPLALVVGDLDHFKSLNDRFGHPAGDEALRRVSALLHDAKRGSDTVARIGGEEFALLLPYTGRPGAQAMAERIRRTVRSAFAEEGVALTISCGIAVFPDDGDTQDLLLRAADAALYAAKELGRDRIAVPPEKVVALRPLG